MVEDEDPQIRVVGELLLDPGVAPATATTVTPPSRSTELRSPKNSSKWTYPTLRASWFPGMTTNESHSSRSRYSFAWMNSGLNPNVVRSPEQTTRSGFRSFTSAIARSIRFGTK
jgi:hypothetical protein